MFDNRFYLQNSNPSINAAYHGVMLQIVFQSNINQLSIPAETLRLCLKLPGSLPIELFFSLAPRNLELLSAVRDNTGQTSLECGMSTLDQTLASPLSHCSNCSIISLYNSCVQWFHNDSGHSSCCRLTPDRASNPTTQFPQVLRNLLFIMRSPVKLLRTPLTYMDIFFLFWLNKHNSCSLLFLLCRNLIAFLCIVTDFQWNIMTKADYIDLLLHVIGQNTLIRYINPKK